uniref:DUF1995 domain-containing protein n=1 Tax=Odontella aurita TaxID=265563 RepID=A0A7S4K824_9STRA|mmetsp:Transcript_6530/g.19255  ORF Transcript_6530/g.19255 Transcript_6530/m.19255 type:complete len:214 (+) Transcript_6530:37-678(+)
MDLSADEPSVAGGADEDENENENGNDIDSFRRQLMSGWDDDEGNTADHDDDDEPAAPEEGAKVPEPAAAPAPAPPSYRLSSLFGSSPLPSDLSSASPNDTFAAAVRAVDANVDDDAVASHDALVVLSPSDPAELVAVRRLVQRFSSRKIIILVNSRLDPLPRELTDATVAYSMRPLVARAAKKPSPSTANNPLRREEEEEEEKGEQAKATASA